jgi:putative transposase
MDSNVPAEIYRRSVYGLEELTYPLHGGTLHRHAMRADLFQKREGESQSRLRRPERRRHAVGERIWLVTFMHYDLGYFDDEVGQLEPIEHPFGPKVLPMPSE